LGECPMFEKIIRMDQSKWLLQEKKKETLGAPSINK
jgi:hypothetical protein